VTMNDALEQSRPGLLARIYTAVQQRQFSPRTERLYLHWITRFVVYHDMQDPTGLSQPHIISFLDHLQHQWHLSRARLNQALKALVFLYEEVLHLPQTLPPAESYPSLST
jgi:hypothetical protein